MSQYSDLFNLPLGEHYLNCAYMSPLLRSVEEIGISAIRMKRSPSHITADDFFDGLEVLKSRFATLVHATSAQSCAFIPSVSYGMANAISNVDPKSGKHCLILKGEFPSGRLALERWCEEHVQEVREVGPAEENFMDGAMWNESVLEAITENSTMLVMSNVHWMNGILFDMKAIGERCRSTDTILIVDGTQGVGAVHMDLQSFHIDALISAGYKWLMGPYSTGMAYYGPYFHHSRPIEESWMNRTNAKAFSDLTNYGKFYSPEAGRFNVGQTSNFILAPMLSEALRQVNEWGTDLIGSHDLALFKPLYDYVKSHDPKVDLTYQSPHILGIPKPKGMGDIELDQRLTSQKISVSKRGTFLRISPHLYNDAEDIKALLTCLS